jgi:hypothetical protein
MADNPVEHSRTKHIDIRYHFLRDHQQKGDIEIAYVNTQNQLADIFTKPLDEKTFTKLRNELNILDSQNFDWNIAHIAHLYTFDHVSFILVQMHISYYSCTKATTNIFSSVFPYEVVDWKGNGVFGKEQGFHSTTLTVSFTLCRCSSTLSIGIILHSYLLIPMGRKYGRLSKSPLLAINAKGGENIKPKAKGPHHHNFKNIWNKVLIDIFHIGIYVMAISHLYLIYN